MKKISITLVGLSLLCIYGCNLGFSDGDKYKNPHMPDNEAKKYGQALERLDDVDALVKSYSTNKTQERFAKLAEMYSELEYNYNDSKMDAEGRRESMLLQARTDSARAAVESLLKEDINTMKFPCISENDLLIESARTWPLYLHKGAKLHYNMSTDGNVPCVLSTPTPATPLKPLWGKSWCTTR